MKGEDIRQEHYKKTKKPKSELRQESMNAVIEQGKPDYIPGMADERSIHSFLIFPNIGNMFFSNNFFLETSALEDQTPSSMFFPPSWSQVFQVIR